MSTETIEELEARLTAMKAEKKAKEDAAIDAERPNAVARLAAIRLEVNALVEEGKQLAIKHKLSLTLGHNDWRDNLTYDGKYLEWEGQLTRDWDNSDC